MASKPFDVHLPPAGRDIPLVLDSPHSGTDYPADFGYACDFALIRKSEDTHVDALFGHAPSLGAPLLAARFPRAYIDPNRSPLDIDPELIDGVWPGQIVPGEKTKLGLGLIWRKIKAGTPVYARKLTVGEVWKRIDECYLPYHAELQRLTDRACARWGRVYHINCHSMPAVGDRETSADGESVRPDFAIGDRDGTTCDPAYTKFTVDFLAAKGYDARANDPYKGVELVRRHGRPAEKRHAIQIEVNRRLYMDEETRERNADFAKTKAVLDEYLEALALWIAKR
jgi:N-formylglutamate amidohydrolase